MRAITIATGLALAVTAACGDATGPVDSIAGIYTLRFFGSSPVPATTFASGNLRAEVLRGAVNLSASGSFTDSAFYRYTEGSTVTLDTLISMGTYQQVGTSLELTPTSPSHPQSALQKRNRYFMTLDGTRLVDEFFVYLK